jgi:hypothetical protein
MGNTGITSVGDGILLSALSRKGCEGGIGVAAEVDSPDGRRPFLR